MHANPVKQCRYCEQLFKVNYHIRNGITKILLHGNVNCVWNALKRLPNIDCISMNCMNLQKPYACRKCNQTSFNRTKFEYTWDQTPKIWPYRILTIVDINLCTSVIYSHIGETAQTRPSSIFQRKGQSWTRPSKSHIQLYTWTQIFTQWNK